MAETPRLKLGLMAAGQAQKHVTFNEAMLQLDLLTGTIPALNRTRTSPPSDASDGAVYIVAGNGSGDWLGFNENDLALLIDGGWRRVLPSKGMVAAISDESGVLLWFNGSNWGVALGGADLTTETAEFSIAPKHMGITTRFDVATETVVTLPADMPAGVQFQLIQIGNGAARFQAATGATLSHEASHNRTFAKWSVAGAIVESNTTGTNANWVLFGSTTA